MTVEDEEIMLLRERIAELPRGYISRKVIAGKERFYLQWREGEKVRSRYIKESEREAIISGIEERKRLEKQLKDLTGLSRLSYPSSSRQRKSDIYTAYREPGSYAGSIVAEKAAEYGSKPAYYLKWADEVIGLIDSRFNVRFLTDAAAEESQNDLDEDAVQRGFAHDAAAAQNQVLDHLIPESGRWDRNDFTDFLQDRIVSPGRRDIELILFRLGLPEYDPVQIGIKTHAISARDMLWITEKKDLAFDDAVTEVFRSVFTQGKDLAGDSVDTPEGQNIKRYGVSNSSYGIYKKRLAPLSTDIESEIAVYLLSERLGVPCCPCWRTDEDTVFSAFQYDFAHEYIVHFRRLMGKRKYDDELKNLISVRPEYLDFFVRMIALDFITRQDDRHLSNIAVKTSGAGEAPYPLYDNGRSLFYEDTEETAMSAHLDIEKYATTFGPAGSYLDHVKAISQMGVSFRKLLDLDIGEKEVHDVLTEAGMSGYRLDGAGKWIIKCISILKELG